MCTFRRQVGAPIDYDPRIVALAHDLTVEDRLGLHMLLRRYLVVKLLVLKKAIFNERRKILAVGFETIWHVIQFALIRLREVLEIKVHQREELL